MRLVASLSALAASVLSALAAASGDWGGLTGQGRAFRFVVDSSGQTIPQIRFNIATACESRVESVGPAQIVGNTFMYDSGASSSCQVQISGTFTSPSTATGTLIFTPHDRFLCGCSGVEGDPMPAPQVTTSWSVNQGCSYTLSDATFNAEISATPGAVNLTTGPTCEWSAISEANFVTVTGGSTGTGSGTVNFTVAGNTYLPGFETQPRTGKILIAGDPFVIIQPGCTFHVTPAAATYGSAGGAGAVDISAPGACSWDVENPPAWASTTSGGMGSGVGTWEYSVSPNAGATRSHLFIVAGNVFTLKQLVTTLKRMTAGTRSAFVLANATDENWSSLEAVAGRSYCGELAPGPGEVAASAPLLTAYRANGSTILGNDTHATPRVCFVAPATEMALFHATQNDPSARAYRLTTTETTLWADWVFIGGDYSSYTLLRNTTANPVEAAITWRTEAGVVARTTNVIIPSHGIVYYDARVMAPTVLAGSVEVGHNGEPQALVGSQTTLSPTAGLAFDAVMRQRARW